MMIWNIILTFILFCNFVDSDVKTDVESLAKAIEAQFNELESVMKPVDLVTKLTYGSKSIDATVATQLLKDSKQLSEEIVSSTTDTVANIGKSVKNLLEIDNNRNKVYSLTCTGNETEYEFYYRAKAVDDTNNTNDRNLCNIQLIKLEPDPTVDNVYTNRELSTSHIPTNVYHAAQDIQQIARITNGMDIEFQKNKAPIQWQYFCSNTGFFKIFPGVKWNIQVRQVDSTPTLVDFFDCRSEQWYLEATSYSKKMVIIVDTSGSMKGRRRIIANHTANEILNTLTENDFFNIILFNKSEFFADNKTNDKLIQGTAKNKKVIMNSLGTYFNPSGIAEYKNGVEKSLQLLKIERDNDVAKNLVYNYMLMIISDGAPSNTEDVFVKYRNVDNFNFRVFTYLIGQGITEGIPIQEMACNNKGYAVQIATLADVKENVQKYLNVVARSNVDVFYPVWTGVQQNQMNTWKPDPASSQAAASKVSAQVSTIQMDTPIFTVSTNNSANATVAAPLPVKVNIKKDEPIKMFVSSSLAVYNITSTISNLLGAVGIDVPVAYFLNTAPFWKLGVNAYLFGVTNNGFLIFHPRFRPQYKIYMKYFFRNVDISEVELNNTAKIINVPDDQVIDGPFRQSIIDFNDTVNIKSIGSNTVYEIIDNFKTAFPITRQYYITRINKTSYTFGIAIPNNQVIPDYSPSQALPDIAKANLIDPVPKPPGILPTDSGTILTFFEHCMEGKKYLLENPLLLIRAIVNRTVTCTKPDYAYINSVIKELEDTDSFIKTIWNTSKDFVQQIFSIHHFGVMRYKNLKTLSYENFLEHHLNGLNDPLYKETVLTSQLVDSTTIKTIVPLPNEEVKKGISPEHLVFTVTMPLVRNKVYGGIVGLQVAQNNFFNKTFESDIWKLTDIYDSYIITTGGLILVSNVNSKHTGEMLKDVDCAVMEVLVQSNVFEKQDLYDFQALCPNQPVSTDSFASRLLDPFTQMFKFTVWILYELMILIQNFSFSSLYWSFIHSEENLEYTNVPDPYVARNCWLSMNYSILINKTNSNYTNLLTSKYPIIKTCCPNTNMELYITGIKNTNLLLLVLYKTNKGCRCECNSKFGVTREILRKENVLKNAKRQIPNYSSMFQSKSKIDTDKTCTDGTNSLVVSSLTILLSTIIYNYFIYTH